MPAAADGLSPIYQLSPPRESPSHHVQNGPKGPACSHNPVGRREELKAQGSAIRAALLPEIGDVALKLIVEVVRRTGDGAVADKEMRCSVDAQLLGERC